MDVEIPVSTYISAFVFADAGFDVWLANVRGTRYGMRHTHYTPNDKAFWNFTCVAHFLNFLFFISLLKIPKLTGYYYAY